MQPHKMVALDVHAIFSRCRHQLRRPPRPGRAQKILAQGNLSFDIADQGNH
jgi:hypothetical protein